jgi:hypothetical protein
MDILAAGLLKWLLLLAKRLHLSFRANETV